MRLKALLLTTTLTVCLCASLAFARSTNLTGSFKGDPDSNVTMKLVVKKGKPRKVQDLIFENLDVACSPSGERSEVDDYLGDFKVVKTTPANKTVYSFGGQVTTDEHDYTISATVNKRNTKVRGEATVTLQPFQSGDTCTNSTASTSTTFKASK